MKAAAVVAVCAAMGFPQHAAASKLTFCGGLKAAVATHAGNASAVFITSYQPAVDEASLPDGLKTTAFVYDNALATIALIGCGYLTEAKLIGAAISRAVQRDRSFTDGRVRNAYRAGPVGESAPALPGWWDNQAKLWAEDPAQDGTSTGNVAWAALALLTLHQATNDPPYLEDATRLVDWIIAHTACGETGFCGGFHGYDHEQVRLSWASTEHNVDVGAVSSWLFRLTGERRYKDAASQARGQIVRAFRNGHFLLGTKPDGSAADADQLALDVQLWPWMADKSAPAEWRQALDFANSHLAVDDGFDFNGDRDGVWVEGTAQAALAYRMQGDRAASDQLLQGLLADQTSSGLLNATRSARVTTGLSIDPTTTKKDFFYFRRPHLGATAWAALAGAGWNPFTGQRVE